MFRWIAILAAIALVAGVAYGQSSNDSDPGLPSGQVRPIWQPGMMGMHGGSMPPMEMMPMGMGPGSMCPGNMNVDGMVGTPASYVEARLAFAKSELAITPPQEPAWTAYASALREAGSQMGMHMGRGQAGMVMAGGFLDRMDARVSHLQANLAALEAVRNPAATLYQTLNETQKQIADAILPMSLCM